MSVVKHKLYGIGEVVGREEKESGTHVFVKFSNGKVSEFVIPESFEVGIVAAEGDLKEEIDMAIAEREKRKLEKLHAEKAESVCVTSAKITKRVGRKPQARNVIKDSSEKAFEEYLIKAGYKEFTDRGNDSTVYSYSKEVRNVIEDEGISWGTLKKNISSIVSLYDVGGKKERRGMKSNKTVINALKRFEEFVNS